MSQFILPIWWSNLSWQKFFKKRFLHFYEGDVAVCFGLLTLTFKLFHKGQNG